ncbi:putative lipid II flippase FtsW [Candidatus Microgenomates bacterium]|nr:MAG: putative lipid II flippase FtsW [Candidatus Microgenomates bacterium]
MLQRKSFSYTHKLGKKTRSVFDRLLFISVIVLALFGLLAVFNSSVVSAFREFGDSYYFIKNQAVFLVLGTILMFVVSRFPYRNWYKLAIPLLFITLILLLAVFIPGIGIRALGAKRWIDLGFFSIQPTEIAKLVLVVYLSAWFANREKNRFVPFLVLLGLVVGLIILQPDLGTAVIISAIAVVLYFVSEAPLVHFLLLIPAGLLGLGVLAIAAPYRLARITTFLNPNNDPLGSSYHIRQVLLALGSGGLFGVGIGKSRQKYEYVPEANTDSIFAIIGEEIGFVGAFVLIAIFMFIAYRSFRVARRAPDRFGRLLGTGIAAWFTIQTLINLGAMVALVPLTGVPLPLVSYGGSNLLMMMIGFGILLNISRHAKSI